MPKTELPCGWKTEDTIDMGLDMYKVADLVKHKSRPDSFGVVDKIIDSTHSLIVWTKVAGPAIGKPEVCDNNDLEWTICPRCREQQCWCGVGR